MKYSEIQNLKADELRKRTHQNRLAWFEARMKGKMGRLSNFKEIANLRQDQARFQTALVKFNLQPPLLQQEEKKSPALKTPPVKKQPPPWKQRKKTSRLQSQKAETGSRAAYQKQKSSVAGVKKVPKTAPTPLKGKVTAIKKPVLKKTAPSSRGEVSKQSTGGLLRRGWSFLFQRKTKSSNTNKTSAPPEEHKGASQ